MPQGLTVVEHPVLADRLSVLRDRDTSHGAFRQALFEASAIMAIEVARELPLRDVTVETPLETTSGQRLRDEVVVVPVLRAGLGMVEGFLRLLPDARVGHLGVYRDEKEHVPIGYYERLPPRLGEARVRP
jgi:uracil phosphoribosyltransferase